MELAFIYQVNQIHNVWTQSLETRQNIQVEIYNSTGFDRIEDYILCHNTTHNEVMDMVILYVVKCYQHLTNLF